MDTLEEFHYFVSTVYCIQKPEYLETVRMVANHYIQKDKEKDNQMLVMTKSFVHEPVMEEFNKYVSQTAWNILKSQGFAVDGMYTYFTEMWAQQHNWHSHIETHVHGHRAQISAFYFLETPKNGCQLVIHDPRHAKVIVNLPEENREKVTAASSRIVMTPQAGTLVLTNSWLPHNFTKNFSKSPYTFVHMNLSTEAIPPDSDKKCTCKKCNPVTPVIGIDECCEMESCPAFESSRL